MRRAVFLDRDGTINVEKEYLHRIDDFQFIPGVPEAIGRLNRAGLLVVVVTNQSGVGRGYYSAKDVEALHRHIAGELEKQDAHVDAWLYCPHFSTGPTNGPSSCDCRKPAPGMILKAADSLNIDLRQSVMIGDKVIDVQAGLAVGCRPILVRSGYGAIEEAALPEGVAVCDDLAQAVNLLLGNDEV